MSSLAVHGTATSLISENISISTCYE